MAATDLGHLTKKTNHINI